MRSWSLESGFVSTGFSDRFNGLGAWFWHQYYGAAFVAKRATHLVAKIFLVLIEKQFVAIHE